MVTIKKIGNKWRITNKGKIESLNPTSATNNPMKGKVTMTTIASIQEVINNFLPAFEIHAQPN